MNILGTGLSGLVGSRVVGLLSDAFRFENLSLETGVDITDAGAVRTRIHASEAPWIWHFAAYTDVDGAEKERDRGQASLSWRVNVEATRTICKVAHETGKRLLFISTDYVFDGTEDSYSETDQPAPIGWYGITKYEGERAVQQASLHNLIVRITNPYRTPWNGKPDFVQRIRNRLDAGQRVTAPEDQVFVPTFIDDIAAAVAHLTRTGASGIYHAVGSEALSPFTVAREIAGAYGYDRSLVTPVTFADFYRDRAPRPLHAYLKNDKITKSGIRMHTFAEGFRVVIGQSEGDV